MGFVCVLGHNLAQYNRPRNSGLKNGSYSSVHSAGQSSPCKGLNFFSALPSLKARRRKWWLEGQSNCWWSLKGVVWCVGMSMGSDSTWVGKKPLRRIGGMSDALSIASDLGFSVAAPPTQVKPQSPFSLSLCLPCPISFFCSLWLIISSTQFSFSYFF